MSNAPGTARRQVLAAFASGQFLDLVGITGDARTTLPHIHFDISRPTFPEDWQTRHGEANPVPFLQAWKDGHNVMPPLP